MLVGVAKHQCFSLGLRKCFSCAHLRCMIPPLLYLMFCSWGNGMGINVRKSGDTAIFDLEGRLALGAPVDEFRNAWTEAMASGSKIIVVNLANVTMVDSSGIGTMIRAHSAVSAGGGKLRIVAANTTVRQAFRITRLDKVFEFHETEETALAAGV